MSKYPEQRPLVFRLWAQFDGARRKQLSLLLLLMVMASVAETLSLGAALPFLGILLTPNKVLKNPYFEYAFELIGMKTTQEILLLLTILFIGASIFAAAIRLWMLWASIRISFSFGADLSMKIYRRTLYQDYSVHCSRNSSVVINGIVTQTSTIIYHIINPILLLLSSSVILFSMLALLFWLNPLICFSVLLGFGSIYYLIALKTHKKIIINGQEVARNSALVIKALQEGLGGIRDVLLDGSQETFCNIYHAADAPLRRAESASLFIALSPRYLIESLGLSLIVVLAYFLENNSSGLIGALPILGVFILAAQRVLPILQQSYVALTSIRGNQESLREALVLLEQPIPKVANSHLQEKCKFEENIVLNDVYFRYQDDATWVFNGLNLQIHKGSRVGFIGTTGVGKSTLVDTIMALLDPTRGSLEVDGLCISRENRRSWQSHIAHVPQSIFLSDSTIEENIAFGIPKDQIDLFRVKKAAEQAELTKTIDGLPNKFKTIVGERGIRLSGGQRQRIGIARALYKEADVIIFDEATSALDSETEESILNSIDQLSPDLTVLFIAHRLTTLRGCSEIYELKNGYIQRIDL